jgi:hypothetical protein
MSDQDQGPSLELPSLGFRRRKKAKPEAAEPESTTEAADAPADEAPTEVIEQVAEPAAEPVAEPVAELVAEALPPVAEPAAVEPAREAPAPAQPGEEPTPIAPAKKPKERKPRKPRTRWLGAGGIGLLAGFAIVGLIGLTLQACDSATGTTSCGGPGLFVLLAILALITVGATRLLRMWGFSDAGTVAFLGIALTGIVVLVFLTTHLQSLGMVLVIPMITMFAFLISDWVSATMSEANES